LVNVPELCERDAMPGGEGPGRLILVDYGVQPSALIGCDGQRGVHEQGLDVSAGERRDIGDAETAGMAGEIAHRLIIEFQLGMEGRAAFELMEEVGQCVEVGHLVRRPVGERSGQGGLDTCRCDVSRYPAQRIC
jgi:hypothetical protein